MRRAYAHVITYVRLRDNCPSARNDLTLHIFDLNVDKLCDRKTVKNVKVKKSPRGDSTFNDYTRAYAIEINISRNGTFSRCQQNKCRNILIPIIFGISLCVCACVCVFRGKQNLLIFRIY